MEVQYLQESGANPDQALKDEFYKEFERNYSEDVIGKFLKTYFGNHSYINASEILKNDMSEEAILKILYVLVYAGEDMDYRIRPLDSKIENDKFELDDFQIIRGFKS